MPFKALNLDEDIVKTLTELGYNKPTPIQETAIPKIIEGCDLLASAQTGSGKTAAFLLPAIHQLKQKAAKSCKGPRILVLVPTRELAMQVATQAVKYSKYLPKVKTVCLYGGAPYPVQNRQLARPYEILVATPGRLIDHYDSGRIDFSNVELFVLDEADRMLDMGFISSVEKLSAALPKKVQTVLFSATLENNILRLAKNLLDKPVEINLAGNNRKHENIEQVIFFADHLTHKMRLLDHLLKDETIKQAIIFTSTKFFANELMQALNDKGHRVGVLHGDLNQRQRTQTTRNLREGKLSILVATDVAARGIDIPNISHVFNFDLPMNVEDYVHRIGRTGRADAEGIAISLALFRDKNLVERIEKFTGSPIERREIEGMKPSPMRASKPAARGPRRPERRGDRSERRGDYPERRGDRPPERRSEYAPARGDRPPERRGDYPERRSEYAPARGDRPPERRSEQAPHRHAGPPKYRFKKKAAPG